MSSSRPDNEARYVFREGKHGLLIPEGIAFGDMMVRPSSIDAAAKTRESLLHFRVGVVPDYDDIWPGPLPELPCLFGALKRQTWLSFLSRFALAAFSPNISRNEFEASVAQMLTVEQRQRLASRFGGTRKALLVYDFAVLLAIELASFLAQDGDEQEDFTPEQAQSLLKPVFLLSQEINSQLVEQMRMAPSGVAAALADRSLLGWPLLILSRSFGLWAWEHDQLSDSSKEFRRAVDAVLQTAVGVTLEDWIAAIYIVSSIFLSRSLREIQQSSLTVDPRTLQISADGQKAVSQVMSQLTATVENFGTRCKTKHDRNALWNHPTVEPLRDTPCVYSGQGGTEVLLLSPVHLAIAAVDGPVRIMAHSGSTNPYTQFGCLVEDHVHGILQAVFGDRYQRLRPAKKRKRAEGIIWYEDAFIVVEVKARRISEVARFQPRSDNQYYDELIGRGLGEALEQINSTISDVFEGVIENRCHIPPRVTGSLIVVSEEIPMNLIAETVLLKALGTTNMKDGVKRLMPQVISLSEVETLDEWQDRRLIDVLNEKMGDPSTGVESLKTYRQFKGEACTESSIQSLFTSGIRRVVARWLRKH